MPTLNILNIKAALQGFGQEKKPLRNLTSKTEYQPQLPAWPLPSMIR